MTTKPVPVTQTVQTPPSMIAKQPHNDPLYAQRTLLAVEKTSLVLQESLWDFMPEGAYRDFYLWALSNANPQRDNWMQLIGLTQIVQLTVRLLGDLVDDTQWNWLAGFTAPFNTYLVYEVVSDNLAIGLTNNSRNPADAQRKTLLHEFNHAVCQYLGDENARGEAVLHSLAPIAHSISSFRQSLSPGKQAGIVRAYLQQNPSVTLPDIEYSVWDLLVANFNAVTTAARQTESFQLGGIIRHGLLQRYQTVDALLSETRLSLEQLTSYSAYAILLVPTIAYYLEGLARIGNLQDRLQHTVETETLSEALLLTAILVRLLNDFGTELLLQSADERWELIEGLYQQLGRSNSQTLNEVLLRAASENSTLLTRLKKDIQHGELNLGLWYLSNVTPVSDAIMLFAHRLEYYSQQYMHYYAQLEVLLDKISTQIGDDALSRVIARCVQFHEALYRNPYDEPEGEYAV